MKKITLSKNDIKDFRRIVYTYFANHGRRLPWRFCNNPYGVFVSEVMLQQTQVDRVIDKYERFLTTFPSISTLAAASPGMVLEAWQGLGYNRRALYLHKAAQVIVRCHNGVIPQTPDQLQTLPGIGKATAASIAAFAVDFPSVFIETNIRTVFIHHFFPEDQRVSDDTLFPLVEQTLDRSGPGRWYNALMDYGVMIKKLHGNPGRKSKEYVRQSTFEGSDRQIRGAIIRFLLDHKPHSIRSIQNHLQENYDRVKTILQKLEDEGFVRKIRRSYVVA